jgi:hypothetical protein
MPLIRFGLSSWVIFSLTAWAAADDLAARFEKIVRPMVQAINADDYAGVQRDFSQKLLESLPPEKFGPFLKKLIQRRGKIVTLDPPRLTPPDLAVFPAHFERGVLDISVTLDTRDKIIGLRFLPHVAPIPVPERHLTALRLPFDGPWRVVWGGDTIELNKHHDTACQRYAIDFVAIDGAGRSHTGPGRRNEDYYTFGRPVLAPADGVVTDVVTGVRDNALLSVNPSSALGNVVFIEHRANEVSVLVHLKQGSIRVVPGDKVKRGQIVGLCGNSGKSSGPHLHFQLQNTSIIQDATGIRCLFDKVNVTRNGKTESKTDYSPIRGDIVEQQ